jgi:hypothetical protein
MLNNFEFRKDFKRQGYHKLIVDNYIVFYFVDEVESQVVIMRLLNTKRLSLTKSCQIYCCKICSLIFINN